MKKGLKISFIVLGILVGIVLLDTLQAKIFDNSPLLKIRENLYGGSTDYIDKGLLVNHYHCNHNEKVTTWKDSKFACSMKEEVGLGWAQDNISYWVQDEKDISFIRDLFKNYLFTAETCDGINDYYIYIDGNTYGIEVYEKIVHITTPGKEIVLNDQDSEHIIRLIQKWQEDYPTKEITLDEINDKIGDYLSNHPAQVSNHAYSYVDEKKQVVVVGLVENNQEAQDDFVSHVFGNSSYKDSIKDNSLIEFRTSKHVFDAEVLENKDEHLTVKVLKDSDTFKKDDTVIVNIHGIIDDLDDSYNFWKNIRITFNGLTELTLIPQIGASKIEMI